MKLCKSCNTEKELEEFYPIVIRKKYPSTSTYCKECTRKQRKVYRDATSEKRNRLRRERRKNDPAYREHIAILKKKSYWKDIQSRLFYTTRSRCKRKNIYFDITIEDIVIPEKCPILDVIFDKDRYSPTIDRIIPKLGYIKNNIRVISKKANTMKNDADFEELALFSKNIIKYINC